MDYESKTSRKVRMHQLQELAVRIAGGNAAMWQAMQLDEQLTEQLRLYQNLAARNHREARRRQAQYLGKLLRAYDQQALLGYFAKCEQMRRYRDGLAAQLGEWFIGLVAGNISIAQVTARLPALDSSQAARLLALVQRQPAPAQVPPQDRLQKKLWQTLVDALPESLPQDDS